MRNQKKRRKRRRLRQVRIKPIRMVAGGYGGFVRLDLCFRTLRRLFDGLAGILSVLVAW